MRRSADVEHERDPPRLEATLQELIASRVIEETRNMQRKIYELDTLRGDAVSALSYTKADLRAALEREAKLRADLEARPTPSRFRRWCRCGRPINP